LSFEEELATSAATAIVKVGHGKASVYGTKVHAEFASANPVKGILSDETYKNGLPEKYCTAGSTSVDAVKGTVDKPQAIGDLKTGTAKLTPQRINEIRSHLPNGYKDIPIFGVR
jgi:hypothetical protein